MPRHLPRRCLVPGRELARSVRPGGILRGLARRNDRGAGVLLRGVGPDQLDASAGYGEAGGRCRREGHSTSDKKRGGGGPHRDPGTRRAQQACDGEARDRRAIATLGSPGGWSMPGRNLADEAVPDITLPVLDDRGHLVLLTPRGPLDFTPRAEAFVLAAGLQAPAHGSQRHGDAGSHRAGGDAEDLADLVVGVAVVVVQDHSRALGRLDRPQRRPQLGIAGFGGVFYRFWELRSPDLRE